MPMIECENLVKIYKTDEIEVVALQGLDLTVEEGEMMAIIGNSGSGKSTLLNMLGGLDKPSAGKLLVDGKDLLRFTNKQYIDYKRTSVGFVWQNNARNLIPYLTARENIEMPLLLTGKERARRSMELLKLVGLENRAESKLGQLSGGEQQRIAIAIALANQPRLLLADEPTGSVDTATANHIMEIFRKANQEMGVTVVIVTHDIHLSRMVDRVVNIRDGRTSSEFIRRSYKAQIEAMNEEERKLAQQQEDEQEDTHQEFAVVDRLGRLQLPPEVLSQAGVNEKNNRLQVELVDGEIRLVAPREEDLVQTHRKKTEE